MKRYLALFAALLTASLCTVSLCPLFSYGQQNSSDAQAVVYSISLAHPEQHLLHVVMTIPPGSATHELQLPVWNALYQVRDFAQYVNWIRAKDSAGRALALREIDDSRWQISGAEAGAAVEYEIFADNAGPFNAQLNMHHAFLNLAQVLMYPVDDRAHAMKVDFRDVPAEWHIATPLRSASPSMYQAESYDRMVDSPVEMGTFQESDFDEAGGHYRIVVDADAADYDLPKITEDVHKIVSAATAWMNDRPFDGYMFIYHFPRGPAGGGMEHAYSTAIDLSADAIRQAPAMLRGVTAHEFFHLWNVKRIRPQALEPVDYRKENYTRALWFSEGCDSTAQGIVELRAGLVDERQYLDRLGEGITELERRPAHLTQSVEESSLDAWLEGEAYYRRPERSISYYNKGELLGVMLDLKLREVTQGRASLRELFQWMNQNFAKQGKFFHESEGVREAAEAVSHSDWSAFFAKYVAGTEEIPWDEFFRTVGLHVLEEPIAVADAGFAASRNFDGPMLVDSVTASSEAERAGLQVGETVLEIQGKVPGQEAREQLSQLKPGDALTVKTRGRRGRERELSWKVGTRQQMNYEVKDLDTVTAAQRARRAAWLKGEAE